MACAAVDPQQECVFHGGKHDQQWRDRHNGLHVGEPNRVYQDEPDTAECTEHLGYQRQREADPHPADDLGEHSRNDDCSRHAHRTQVVTPPGLHIH